MLRSLFSTTLEFFNLFLHGGYGLFFLHDFKLEPFFGFLFRLIPGGGGLAYIARRAAEMAAAGNAKADLLQFLTDGFTSAAMAKLMAAKMLMMEPEEISDQEEVADAFGEIVNMLGGNFKNAWVETGNQMELCVPNVVFNGRVRVNSDAANCLRSCVRVQLDDEVVDIGVHFEAQD